MFKKKECTKNEINTSISKNEINTYNSSISKNDIIALQKHMKEIKELFELREKHINKKKSNSNSTSSINELVKKKDALINGINNNSSIEEISKLLLTFFNNLSSVLYTNGDSIKINAIKDILKALKNKNIINKIKKLKNKPKNKQSNKPSNKQSNTNKELSILQNKLSKLQQQQKNTTKSILNKINGLSYTHNKKTSLQEEPEEEPEKPEEKEEPKEPEESEEPKEPEEQLEQLEKPNELLKPEDIPKQLNNEENKEQEKNNKIYFSEKPIINLNRDLISKKQDYLEKRLFELSDQFNS
tara:strand:- start:319 stop:1215 length:897 start_codon:yes stop_codon:yes gene_type:complete